MNRLWVFSSLFSVRIIADSRKQQNANVDKYHLISGEKEKGRKGGQVPFLGKRGEEKGKRGEKGVRYLF